MTRNISPEINFMNKYIFCYVKNNDFIDSNLESNENCSQNEAHCFVMLIYLYSNFL